MTVSYTARWIMPLDGPALEGGIVTIEGDAVLTVEPRGSRRAEDLGDVASLAAFVNAHVHLDLCGMVGLAPPSSDFTGWLRRVVAHRRQRTPQQIEADIASGLADCLRFGTATLGDISGDGASWSQLIASPLRAVVFREVLGLTPERAAAAIATMSDWSKIEPVGECRPGISPHAPYSVSADVFRAAGQHGVPVCTHLAESLAEIELLIAHTGPFVPFLQSLGVWHPESLATSPKHVLDLLAEADPLLLAHSNYLTDTIPQNATVVYCPRTHAAFGHPPHPFAEMMARGVRVALGTDGLASNPDLDMLAEVRFLHQTRPEIASQRVLQMATSPEVLGFPRRADLVAIPIPAQGMGDPHTLLIEEGGELRRLMIGGNWVNEASRPA